MLFVKSAEELLSDWSAGSCAGSDIITWAVTATQELHESKCHPMIVEIACLSASSQEEVDRAPRLLEALVRETVDFEISAETLNQMAAEAAALLARSDSVSIDECKADTVILGLCPPVAPYWVKQRRDYCALQPGLYALTDAMVYCAKEAIQADDERTLADLAAATELLIARGTAEVANAMTIGFLEGISNTCGHDPARLPYRRLVRFLGPASFKRSRELDRFWGTRMTDE